MYGLFLIKDGLLGGLQMLWKSNEPFIPEMESYTLDRANTVIYRCCCALFVIATCPFSH